MPVLLRRTNPRSVTSVGLALDEHMVIISASFLNLRAVFGAWSAG
jgi:hypothetical protein